LTGRCDSFVVETDVHFPTDINLLYDAIRKIIQLIAMICDDIGISGWRQSRKNIKSVKKLYRKVQKIKHSTSKNQDKRAQKEKLIHEAYREYVDLVESFITKAKVTLNSIGTESVMVNARILEIKNFIVHAERQIDQIQRRVFNGEKIPHDEKVFSLFEPHTEWISKGKAGVPQELGLKVCILEDQYGFILHHRVMEKETDDKIAILMVEHAKKKFPEFNACSFDKGFYSPSNKAGLEQTLDTLTMPKKGKLSQKAKEHEYSEVFLKSKRQHSAVESAINALENHGLDRCRDHGIKGFKRYIGLAVLARNIQIIGNHLQQKELKKWQRFEKKAA